MHSSILRAAILPLFAFCIVETGCALAPNVEGVPPPNSDLSDFNPLLEDVNGPGAPPPECSVQAVNTFPRVNLFIAVDRSAAMTYGNKWTMTTSGLSAFVGDAKSAGLRVALGFFPANACGLNPSCKQPECGDLVVPLGAIGPVVGEAHGKTLLDTLKQVKPQANSFTPEESALKLAEGWAVDYANAHPGETTMLAFVTALNSDVCNIDMKALSSAAATAKKAGVLTYAIGLSGTSIAALDVIAQAGGTGQATILSDVNANNELSTALKTIRGGRLACRMAVPSTQVNDILFTPTNSPLDFPLAEVANANACGTSPAYYIDSTSSPKQIALCPVTCSEARADGSATLELNADCRTR